MATTNMHGRKKWLDVQRRVIPTKDAAGNVTQRTLPHWYGRMKVNGAWKWFKLFTDQRASQKRGQEMIAEHEQKEAGVITTQMEAAQKPLAEHVAEYLESQKRIVSPEHYRIVKYMLNGFFKLAGWRSLSDINEQSATRVLNALQAEGKTVAYTNQYLARVKAFISWCLPDRLLFNPLAKLRRGNLRKAAKKRARRPLAEHEISKLLATCPPSRRLKYAFPLFTGLRRGELADVRWDDLHLDSVIPFLQLRPEQTKTGEATALPLHPYLVEGLKHIPPRDPEDRLFSSLPEGRTMLQDLEERAGIKQADASGRRADFHALRHTFAKRLDETGCSHATRRALLRHSVGDQTDGYTLSRLSEMYDAVKRLPYPNLEMSEVEVKTGTDDLPLYSDTPVQEKEPVVTGWTQPGPASAASGKGEPGELQRATMKIDSVFPSDSHNRLHQAPTGLKRPENRDIVEKMSPRSSVG